MTSVLTRARSRIVAAGLAAFCAAGTTLAANGTDGTRCGRGLDVPITIYNRSSMKPNELASIVETASGLWRPYGVTLAAGHDHGVAVIVSDGSAREDSRESLRVLGTTLFSDGHAVPYIHLWLDAAAALLEGSGAPPESNMPTAGRDTLLLPMLGVALAHELGHVLLDTSSHTAGGILQRSIPLHDLQHPTAVRLGLSVEQQVALCASKETKALGISH